MAKKSVTRRIKKQRGGLNWEEQLNSPTAEERRGMALLKREGVRMTTSNEMRSREKGVKNRINTRRKKTAAVGSRILPRGQKLRYNTP